MGFRDSFGKRDRGGAYLMFPRPDYLPSGAQVCSWHWNTSTNFFTLIGSYIESTYIGALGTHFAISAG